MRPGSSKDDCALMLVTLESSTVHFLRLIITILRICPSHTSGMMHHNNLVKAVSKNTTVHYQNKLSSLLSSTAWVYFGELRSESASQGQL